MKKKALVKNLDQITKEIKSIKELSEIAFPDTTDAVKWFFGYNKELDDIPRDMIFKGQTNDVRLYLIEQIIEEEI
jgi:hypothetical protein